MPFLHAKVLTCPACRETVFCAPDQAEGPVTCPQCGTRVAPPDGQPEPPPLPPPSGGGAPVPPLPPPQPQAPRRKPPCLPDAEPRRSGCRRKGCLLFGCLGGCLGVILLTVGLGVLMALPWLIPERVESFCERSPLTKPLVSHGLLPATSPATATLGGSDIDIAVTRVELVRPTIYQEALRTASQSQTTVYGVTVEITNRGSAPVHYRSWRELASEADLRRAATLRDGVGLLHGAVSFGPRTWPQGTQPEQEIAPGGSCQDLLLFEQGGNLPEGDYLLTLPGENLGHKGALRFRIPHGQVLESAASPGR